MPIFTPHRLKIRLNSEIVEVIVKPLAIRHPMTDILWDVELWEHLPKGPAVLAASTVAVYTNEWLYTILAGFAVYLIGSLIRSFTYSDFLRKLISLFLGSPPLLVIYTIGVPAYLIWQGSYALATILFVLDMAIHIGLLELLKTFLLLGLIRRLLGLFPTHQEHVYMAICNRRAKRYGIVLDWEQYNKFYE